MADDESNLPQVIQWLHDFVDGFNFTLPGRQQSLGRDVAHLVANRIARRASQEGRGASPTRWHENSDRPAGKGYKSRKRKAYGWQESDGKPNYRTGQMLSEPSLFGQTQVEPKRVLMRYGLDEAARDCKSPTDNRTPSQKRGDAAVTDRQKAGYAHELGRDFYELDDQIVAALVAEIENRLATYIRDHN